jgi:hypothetical protein
MDVIPGNAKLVPSNAEGSLDERFENQVSRLSPDSVGRDAPTQPLIPADIT